eukprot:TRINITY_DN3868_c0_g1_i1.p1 TRINITY_DN3868_c0_g1~~TRINITY_DN3868_c0_g1_i1.p1  ORF type:complete len:165 (+),score=23.58 TRINITY_DN3868_c0_g1_i1:1204-1698(+)
MLLGRHRGLPDNIDPAVTIPEAKQFQPGKRRRLQEISAKELFLLNHPITIKPGRPSGKLDSSPSFFRRVSDRLGGQSPNSTHSYSLERHASLPTVTTLPNPNGRAVSPGLFSTWDRNPSMPTVRSERPSSPSRSQDGRRLPRSLSDPERGLPEEFKQGSVPSPL